jgi:predicted nicotinamide N-methyase
LEFEFEGIDHPIVLRQKSQIDQSTGLALWTCSQVLTGYLLDNPHFVKDKSVLELGSGLGLVSLVSHCLGADRVLATDGDVDVLANLRYNVRTNMIMRRSRRELAADNNIDYDEDIGEEKKTTDYKGLVDDQHNHDHNLSKIICPQLVWGKNLGNFEEQFEKQEVMLGTDIFYSHSTLEPLWRTIDKLLAKDGCFLLSFCPHNVPITSVLDKAREFGFSWTKPNIMEGVSEEEEEDEQDGYLDSSCSFGYHIFVFRRLGI